MNNKHPTIPTTHMDRLVIRRLRKRGYRRLAVGARRLKTDILADGSSIYSFMAGIPITAGEFVFRKIKR